MKIEFSLFPGGVSKALTMSFDDGRSADLQLADLFDSCRIRGTFHLNSGNLDQPGYLTKEQVRELSRRHEIAAHGRTHPFLDKIPSSFAVSEVMDDRQALEQCSDDPVRGLSYPYGTYTQELLSLLKGCGIEYSRTIESTGSFYLPQDFMQWHPTCHQAGDLEGLWQKLMKMNKHIRLFYIWGHSYEFDRDHSWDRMKHFCQMAGNRDDIWYATNIEIKDYVTAMRRLIFSVDRRKIYNPSATAVWLKADGQTICVSGGQSVTL